MHSLQLLRSVVAQKWDADAIGGEVVPPWVGQVELQAINGTLRIAWHWLSRMPETYHAGVFQPCRSCMKASCG